MDQATKETKIERALAIMTPEELRVFCDVFDKLDKLEAEDGRHHPEKPNWGY